MRWTASPVTGLSTAWIKPALLLLGETHGRRDYVYIYEGPALKSVVKNKYKMHLPATGENPIGAGIFDLDRDPREERPIDSIKMWSMGWWPVRKHDQASSGVEEKISGQAGYLCQTL